MSDESNKTDHYAIAALLLTQLMFGTATVLGKFALLAFPPFALVGFRVGGAALAFFVLQRLRGTLRLDERSHYLHFAFFAFVGIALNQLLFFKGLSLTKAANTSLLSVTIPIFTIAISVLIGNDRLTWRKVAGISVAAVGVVYLIDPSRASFSSETTQGDILIVLNSLCYAFYVAISKKLISHYGALKSIVWLFIFGSIVTTPIGLFSLSGVDLGSVSGASWGFAAALVIFPTILAYYFSAFSISRVEPSVVAVYVYLQPLIGFVSAIIFLDEHFSIRLFVASILVFVGVYLVTRKTEATGAV
ncbi:MAG: DMT family transporter [Acidobacteria bacterium]|nr:DMT family transporter [Acidobacteriota bacterium]